MKAPSKRIRSRTRMVYLCEGTAHRTHRALVGSAREHGWIAHTAPYAYAESFTPDDFPYDAVISHFNAADTKKLYGVVGDRPHVTLHADAARQLDIPSVVMDHPAAGRLVAQHFISLQFEHFAAFGVDDLIFSQRYAGFSDAIREAGLSPPREILIDRNAMLDYRKGVAVIGEALQGMPMPLAVMAHNDRYAIGVMHTCLHHGFAIPAQVALCGFDNDPVACDLAPVPLSSLDTNPEEQISEATGLIANLINGKRIENRQIRIQPSRLVVRLSSGITAIKNLTVAKALAYIHEHAWSPDLTIPEIADELGVAESSLYATFRKEMSQTPLKYITNLRIEKAKRLLGNTDAKITEVRSACGFNSDYQMYMAFKRTTGGSPGSFRNKSA